MSAVRRTVPMAILSITALILILDYFLPVLGLGFASGKLQSWSSIAVAFSLGLGFINMTSVHLKNFMKREKGVWPFSIWLIIVMYATTIAAIYPPMGSNAVIKWINTIPRLTISATLSATIGFFQATAVYRAFRARSIEAFVLLLSSALVMLFYAPIGGAIWPGFPQIGNWIMEYPNSATMKVILLTSGLGLIQLALRVILGRETTLIGSAAREEGA
jgi:hypothetical protein